MTVKTMMKPVLASALGALMFATGCQIVRPEADNLDSIGPDEVAVVGRVRLDPVFKDSELQMNAIRIGSGWFKDVFLATGDAPWGDQAYPPSDDWSIIKKSVHTKWNTWYFVRFPRHDFYIQTLVYYTKAYSSLESTGVSGGEMEMHSASMDVRRAYLPADLKIVVKPTDRVIFIGTWTFKRDEFNAPQGLRIRNDLDDVMPLIRARFGDVEVRTAVPRYSREN